MLVPLPLLRLVAVLQRDEDALDQPQRGQAKGERERYAAGINKIADEWEKQLPAFRKAARAVADTYLSLPESAVASFNGATGGVLKSNIPLCDAFAHGDGIESAIRDLRQHAAMIVSGERALPLASDRTLGSRLQMFGLNPRAA